MSNPNRPLLSGDGFASEDEPACMHGLTDDQKEQLSVLLEQYMLAMETGLPPTVENLTASCPELCEPLRVCVGGLESLHRMAGGQSTPFSIQDEMANEDPENQLGDFVLHEPIGRGGMGVVYRATQRSLRRTVAIKILPLAAVLDPRQLTRFRHEAEAAAGLQHPNIVPVHAIGCERGVHFYAMRYIDGESLGQWIERQESQYSDWQELVRYAIQVAEGIQAAHEFGIVHRDIKPSNLLLDGQGKVWIADFGLARIQSDVSLTGSRDVVGTIRYMSPEQACGDSAIVDGRTDIYSLAATLYELLTLRAAHDSDDAATILRQMDEDSHTSMRHLRPDLPRDLETVVAKAMARKRDDRYETASHFADDLRRVLTGEPTIARPPTAMDKLVRLAANHRSAVMTTLLIGVLALAGFAIGTTKLAAEKQVSDAFAAQSQRDKAITREAVDRLGVQISELLADIPAANSVRHRLLLETLEYYQQIAKNSESNIPSEDQQFDLAITYGKMGVFQGELGQATQAIKSLQESERIYAALSQQSPRDDKINLQWSISQNNLAQRLAQSGDLQSAGHWFAKAIETQNRLGAKVELARTLNNLGGMLADAGRIEESQDAFQKSLGLLSDSDQHASLQATIGSNLAGLLAKHDPMRATQLAKNSLEQQLDLLERDPSDPKQATQVMLTLNTLATSLTQVADHRGAVESLQQAVQIGQQLRTRWPDQPTYQRDLVLSLNQLGLALSATGDLTQACRVLDQAVQHGQSLNQAYAADAEVQSMLGGLLNNLAFLKQRLGDHRSAKRLYEDAIKHQQVAIGLAPQSPLYQASLKTQQHNLKKLRGES
ncbi:protein kinase [Rubripirellula amarantea]|uniref:serine/threonine-protein kinase n=1 Tax=Rubripirellula amarantea TaxID=2527999 RepID=UPI001F5FBA0D|nr:serine/threonine-protein kinase [Rubripirellula amarantea]MDA8745514.1 protein kinase [Rubripirellula amarantea]